jgi:hypothetical protein
MVESDANPAIRAGGRLAQHGHFCCRTPGGLFDEHVFTRTKRAARDRSERIVGRRDDDDIHVRFRNGVFPGVDRLSVWVRCSQLARSSEVHIGADDYMRARERCRSLSTDETATDDGDAEAHRSPHVLPRSFGTTRRSV